ncbi:MAG: hypothetical protein AB8G11_18810 [Saprospiraceae bacterium]
MLPSADCVASLIVSPLADCVALLIVLPSADCVASLIVSPLADCVIVVASLIAFYEYSFRDADYSAQLAEGDTISEAIQSHNQPKATQSFSNHHVHLQYLRKFVLKYLLT